MRIATEVLVEKYKDHLFAAAFNVCKNAADNRYSGHMDEASFLKIKTTRMSRPFSCMSQEERSGLFLVFRQSAFNTNGTYG